MERKTKEELPMAKKESMAKRLRIRERSRQSKAKQRKKACPVTVPYHLVYQRERGKEINVR
jgi:hypothetical protein